MLRLYLTPLVGALLVSLVATPLSIALARRFGAIDALNARKIHSVEKPRWGGIGIMAGFFSGIILPWFFIPEFGRLLKFTKRISHGDRVFSLNLAEQLAGILFGAVVLFVLGLADDRKGVKPGIKFLLQIIAAFVAMTYGVRIYGLALPGFESYAHFPIWITMLVTILWLVGLSNAVNLIDGLDGLAAGVVAIIAAAYLAVTLIEGKAHSALVSQQLKLAGVIAAALLGGTAGFLVYNFYPAQVFMGDSGSLTLGFLVGCIAVIGTFKTTILAVLIVPLLLVAVPVADMTLAFGRRLLKRTNPFAPDRGHLHHRLLDRGWTQREVVLLVYVITLALAFVSVTAVAMKR